MLFAQDDLPNILGFVSRFYTTLGVERVDIDTEALRSALEDMREHLDGQPGGVESASPFKKAASFLCHFIEARPIRTRLPAESTLGKALTSATGTEPEQNAVIALRIAMESVHRARLRRADGKMYEVSRRLDLSKHSYVDIVDALTEATPTHFKYVAVLLEQLTYKTNPRCQYRSYQVSNFESPECQLEPVIRREDLLDVWAGRTRLEVVENPIHALKPDEVVDGLEKRRLSEEPNEPPHTGRYYFRQSEHDPTMIDRVAADGSVATGSILDGVFVEERVSDIS